MGLRAEVGVLDDERTSFPSVFEDNGRFLALPAAALPRLTGVIAAAGRRFGGLPSDGRDLHPRGASARVHGGGGDRRPWAGTPALIWSHNMVPTLPRGGMPGRGLYRVELVDVCSQGAAGGGPSDPLGDPSGLF